MRSYIGIRLDRDKEQHLYIQLYRGIRKMIFQRQIREGEKLPPVRKLAQMLGVNTVTVVKAYEILEKEEIVYKRVGSGTYVSPRISQLVKGKKPEEDVLGLMPDLGEDMLLATQSQLVAEENVINFASGTPSADLFPVEEFKQALNHVLDRDRGAAFGQQEGQGYYPLRQALRENIRKKGMIEELENIHIISGAQQGIDIVAKAMLSYGDYVFMENPTYTGALGAFRSRGARIVELPLEKDGLDLEALEKRIKSHTPKLLYLMPNFQNPTGISYSMEKKQLLIEMAEHYGFYLLEDDYLSDFLFLREEAGTLKAMDHGERVIYIKSFSQILMPGLRLGFLVMPPSIQGRLLLAKHNSDISTSGLIQRAFESYLSQGKWEEHIRRMEQHYLVRFEAMKQAIDQYMPTTLRCRLPEGGVNFWFHLPRDVSSAELLEAAQREQILFLPGSIFFVDHPDHACFRLNISGVNPEEIHRGTKRLFEIAQALIRKKG